MRKAEDCGYWIVWNTVDCGYWIVWNTVDCGYWIVWNTVDEKGERLWLLDSVEYSR